MSRDTLDPPDFLNRLKPNGDTMTAPAPKKKRQDAMIARATISIMLDMSDAETLAKAVKALDGLEKSLPTGSKVEYTSRGLGKV
jgi:hypothetical protein